jgi:hypothetical protein
VVKRTMAEESLDVLLARIRANGEASVRAMRSMLVDVRELWSRIDGGGGPTPPEAMEVAVGCLEGVVERLRNLWGEIGGKSDG